MNTAKGLLVVLVYKCDLEKQTVNGNDLAFKVFQAPILESPIGVASYKGWVSLRGACVPRE